MSEHIANWKEKVQFYGPLEAMLAAWAAMGVVLVERLALGKMPAFVLVLGGMLAILALAHTRPEYHRLRG
jgi:hypothetical protein